MADTRCAGPLARPHDVLLGLGLGLGVGVGVGLGEALRRGIEIAIRRSNLAPATDREKEDQDPAIERAHYRRMAGPPRIRRLTMSRPATS